VDPGSELQRVYGELLAADASSAAVPRAEAPGTIAIGTLAESAVGAAETGMRESADKRPARDLFA
jgi:hypothetical protein